MFSFSTFSAGKMNERIIRIHNSIFSIVWMTMCINHRSKFFLYDKKKPFPRGTIRVIQNFPIMYKPKKSCRRNRGAVQYANRIYIRIIFFDLICIYFCMSCLRPHYYHISKTILRYGYFFQQSLFRIWDWEYLC